MDWRDRIVIEQVIDDKYWDDIIKSRLETGDFYNIKILIKEERNMDAYKEFLAELESEMAALKSTDVNAVVDEKVAEYREKVIAEETAKKEKAVYEKQIEIDAIKRLIAKVEAPVEVATTESCEEGE